MDSDDFISIGHVKKTNGINGELKIRLLDWDYSRMDRVKALFFKQYDDFVPYLVEQFKLTPSEELLVKLEDVDVVEDAASFVHSEAFIPKEVMEKLDVRRFTEHQITGYKVSDIQYGDLGFIAEITATGPQKMILIQTGEDEILIPFVDDMISSIDHNAESVILDTPEGLIDLNQDDEDFFE